MLASKEGLAMVSQVDERIKTLEKLFEEDAAEEARLRAAAKEEDD